MKYMLVILMVALITIAGFGQTATILNGGGLIQPATGPTYALPDHPRHASQSSLRPEQSLLSNSNDLTGSGERPLWEFPDKTPVRSLGEIAREYRAEHAKMAKAVRCWYQ